MKLLRKSRPSHHINPINCLQSISIDSENTCWCWDWLLLVCSMCSEARCLLCSSSLEVSPPLTTSSHRKRAPPLTSSTVVSSLRRGILMALSNSSGHRRFNMTAPHRGTHSHNPAFAPTNYLLIRSLFFNTGQTYFSLSLLVSNVNC